MTEVSRKPAPGPLFRLAFTVTVGAAVVMGVLWVISLIVGESGVLDTLLSVLTGVVTVGGVAMGVTYLAAMVSSRR